MKVADPVESRVLALWSQSVEPSSRTATTPPHRTEPQSPDLSPVSWLMPRLLRLTAALGHRPVETLRPTIRGILLEHSYCGVAGDKPHQADTQASAEQLTEYLIKSLERAKSAAEQTPHR